MRIVHLSTRDSLAGAFRATNRLHQGLRQAGIDSQMLVARKYTQDSTVHLPTATLPQRVLHAIRMWREKRPLKAYPNLNDLFSPAVVSANLHPAMKRLNPDIIHLHWTAHGFVRPEDFATWQRPVVWTMHDMWAFTGGCHYSGDCTKYEAQCGACPKLGSSQPLDLSHTTWQKKQRHWHTFPLTTIAPSHWLANCARQSSLFQNQRVEVIPNGIDTSIYHPMAKAEVRAQLGLPQDAKLILFGAMSSTSDARKGYQLLLPALHRLAQHHATIDPALSTLQLVVVGADQPSDGATLPMPSHFAGYVSEESKLAALYAAADVFVAPSLEDNLPNTVMEAIACGVPTVAFNIGGMPDMIEHQANGYLATPFDVDDLANGMAWVLADASRYQALSAHARAKVLQQFTIARVADQSRQLYTELLLLSVAQRSQR